MDKIKIDRTPFLPRREQKKIKPKFSPQASITNAFKVSEISP